MNFKNKWEGESSRSKKEAVRLKQYHDKKKGLIFTEFNTTKGLEGKLRSLDAIRFPDSEGGIYKAKGNYEKIKKLIKNNPVELIEVHKWGFYGFGQLVGKSKIVEKYWSPKKVKKVLITLIPNRFHPKENPDPPTNEVFRKFDIDIFVPTETK